MNSNSGVFAPNSGLFEAGGLSEAESHNVCVSVEQYLRPRIAEAIAHALDDMLHLAISLFGPRDLSFTVYSVEFGQNYPQVSYPWMPERGVRIRLSEGAYRWASYYDCRYAFWQLAHECIHLLSPVPGERVSVLEEGVACWFQGEYMKERYRYDEARQYIPSFIRAEAMVRRVLAADVGVVRRLRESEPVISHITAEHIRRCCLTAPLEVAEDLTQRYHRDS